MPIRHFLFATIIASTAAFNVTVFAQEKSIVVASTTSTQDSGLFGYLLPIFKTKTGIDVKVLAQGTGQALDTASRGDADVVFVHDKAAEEKFLADGFGVRRESQFTGQAGRYADRSARRPPMDASGCLTRT